LTSIFKIFIKATTKGNTIVVEAVIEPSIESKNTEIHAIKNMVIFGLYPL
jgi:uncharacterized surface protein with fasciclin (FAS1) repeats